MSQKTELRCNTRSALNWDARHCRLSRHAFKIQQQNTRELLPSLLKSPSRTRAEPSEQRTPSRTSPCPAAAASPWSSGPRSPPQSKRSSWPSWGAWPGPAAPTSSRSPGCSRSWPPTRGRPCCCFSPHRSGITKWPTAARCVHNQTNQSRKFVLNIHRVWKAAPRHSNPNTLP